MSNDELKKDADGQSLLTVGLCVEALLYLMERFDNEVWNCEHCGHAEDTATTDSAIWLREWLTTHNI